MSLELFFAKNKIQREEEMFVVTKAFVGPDGLPIEWKLKPLEQDEIDALRKSCFTYDSKTKTKSLDESKFSARLITEAVVFPDLLNVELQKSYGVNNAEALLKKMVSSPGEYRRLSEKVLQMAELDESLADLIVDAKN